MQLTKQILYNLIIEELKKGGAYKHKSKKGKESVVKVVDPKNQHGSAVLTKVNPETLDPLSKRVFAVNPEKFEATAEPIKGDAAGEPADDGQCGPGKKFNGRTGEPCPAEGGAGDSAEEMKARFEKEMEKQDLLNDIMKGIYKRAIHASKKFRQTGQKEYLEWQTILLKKFNQYEEWLDAGKEEEIISKMKQFAKHA